MKLILSSIIIFFYSCQNSNKDVKTYSLRNSNSELIDIYIENDTFVKVAKVGNSASVFHWGVKNKFENKGLDTVPFSYLNKNKLKFKNGYIFFIDGCGSGCNYIYLMKLNKNDKGILRMYPLLTKIESDIIIYKGEDERNLLVVENLKNNITTKIVEDYDKSFRPLSLAIDTLYFDTSNKLVVKWIKEGMLTTKTF